MLRLLFSLLLCAHGLVLSAQSPSPLRVQGTISGIEHGRLLLVAQSGEQRYDTIARATFTAPHFSISATLTEPMLLRIFVEGYGEGFSLMAEPAQQYEAHLSADEHFYLRGGMLHEAYSQFQQAHRARQLQLKTLHDQRDALRAAQKFRSASALQDSISRLSTAQQSAYQHFYNSHANDLIGATQAYEDAVRSELSLSAMQARFAALGPIAQQSSSGRLLAARIARTAQTSTGRLAPDFTLSQPDGQPLSLSQISAKVKIIDFWASWCGPCRLNHPSLRQLYADYHDKGLEIIAISLDENATAWQKAIAKDQLAWPQVSSLQGWKCPIAQAYSVTSVPAMFVLDADNHIIAQHLRGDDVRQFIHQQLSSTP